MKPDQLYQNLKEVAEKLGITVKEQNVRNVGIHVSSGLCRIEDEQVFIMDKRLAVREKVATLAESLSSMSLDDVYIVPAVRALLDSYKSPSVTDDDANAPDDKISDDKPGENPEADIGEEYPASP
mgnify:CR=1 FL=1